MVSIENVVNFSWQWEPETGSNCVWRPFVEQGSSEQHRAVCLTAIDLLSLSLQGNQRLTGDNNIFLWGMSLRNDWASGCVLSFIKDVQKTFGSLESVISLNVFEGSLLCSPRLHLYETWIPFTFIHLADAFIQSDWQLKKITFYFNVF